MKNTRTNYQMGWLLRTTVKAGNTVNYLGQKVQDAKTTLGKEIQDVKTTLGTRVS